MYLNSFRLFLFILIFTPLAFGTVHQWSLTILECLSIGALLIFLISLINKKDLTLYEIPGIVPLLCLWAYFVLQIIPLPSFVVRFVSPETYKIYAETVGIIEPTTWISLSIHKKSTLLELLRFSGYIAFYVLTIQLLTNKDLLKKTISVVIIFSSLLAFYALIQHFFGSSNKIYWLKETYGASPFGPFVNRNHYAGFMGMLFPVALGLFLAIKPKTTYSGIRQRLIEFLKEKRINIHILLGLGTIIIAFSVFLSLSRGGIISLSLSMLLFTILLWIRRTSRRRTGMVMFIVSLIVLLVSWFGWGPIIARFEKLFNIEGNIAELRAQIWSDSLQIIKDFPFTGTGFGTFKDIYPKYASIKEEIIIQYAHNDYIELLTNGGSIALLLSAWFIISVILKSFRSFSLRKDSYAIYLYIGCLTGIISILLHSFTDFNLQIGSNGLYFIFLMGLMVSTANTRLHNSHNNTYLKPVKQGFYGLVTIFSCIFFVLTLTANLGIIIGNHYYSHIRDLRLEKVNNADLMDVREMALKASLFDPLESEYIHFAANVEVLLNNPESAKRYYLKAFKLNPLYGEYAQRLGIALAPENPTLTERLLKTGIASEPTNHLMYKTYASWLFSEGRKVEALTNINIAMSISPYKTEDYITFMKHHGLSYDDIQNALPVMVTSHIIFADYLLKEGDEKKAEEAYLKAIQLSKDPKETKSSYFHKVYNFYFQRNRYEDALHVMQKAKTLFPSNAGFRILAGSAYEKLGKIDLAIKEYNEALMLDKGNKQARKRLQILKELEGKN